MLVMYSVAVLDVPLSMSRVMEYPLPSTLTMTSLCSAASLSPPVATGTATDSMSTSSRTYVVLLTSMLFAFTGCI